LSNLLIEPRKACDLPVLAGEESGV
jgi:hypothetical protein